MAFDEKKILQSTSTMENFADHIKKLCYNIREELGDFNSRAPLKGKKKIKSQEVFEKRVKVIGRSIKNKKQ